ncbi:hypothetical protein LCGC14_2046180, partial [marine sediment metagenome]
MISSSPVIAPHKKFKPCFERKDYYVMNQPAITTGK